MRVMLLNQTWRVNRTFLYLILPQIPRVIFFENAVAVSQVMVSKTNASDRWLFGEIQVELIR